MNTGQLRGGARAVQVQQRWNPFWALAEPARLRRGRAAAREGNVLRWSVRSGQVEAEVRSVRSAREQYRVALPWVDWWEPYAESVAGWFRNRPDWLAALLAGEWPEAFVAFSGQAGLRLFPDADTARRMRDGAHCTCPDPEVLCKHVIAVVVRLAEEAEARPLRALEFAGLPQERLLDMVHAQTARMCATGETSAGREPAAPEEGMAGAWALRVPASAWLGAWSGGDPAVRPAPSPPAHRITPVFDEEKLARLVRDHASGRAREPRA